MIYVLKQFLSFSYILGNAAKGGCTALFDGRLGLENIYNIHQEKINFFPKQIYCA